MVLSGGPSPASSGGVDRFYCPPARRRQLQQQQAAAAAARPPPPGKPSPGLRPDSDASPSPSPTNLERFIASTTLRVPAQHLSRTSLRGRGMASMAYYELADLWESFKEWSAYGAGVPLVLNGTDGVVQYYVPFLSAIQLYADRSRPTAASRRRLGEDSDGDNYQDTSSDASSESDNERLIGERRGSLANTSCADQEGFSSDDSESGNQQRLPVFQYLEHDAPYGRQPLADKISILASKCPDLKTFRSCDLLPSSWISVAWYPIYRIPTGPTLQDLDACFLTFHSLSIPLEGTTSGHPDTNGFHNNKIADVPGTLALPLIGLASYKFRGSIWTSNGQHERQLATFLLQAADDWLCQRQVDHPDYRFFLSHSSTSL